MQDTSRSSTVTSVKTEDAKKVPTYDVESGEENGFLMELFKDESNSLTEVYLSAVKPGAFKGYHLHKVRGARYMCIKGAVKVILYVDGKREEHTLSLENKKRLYIPPNVPTGLECAGDEDGWLINYPDPPYDPGLKDEQVDYTRDEMEKGQ
jgi:dTDP-4-dehydrorhamnose 3,5-epimerase-like enzyme